MWKILKIYNRGDKGTFAHIFNEDPEHSDFPNTLADYVFINELPKYGIQIKEGENGN